MNNEQNSTTNDATTRAKSTNEVYGLALISLGHVMYQNGIEADAAWSAEYELDHVRYLTDNGVDPLVVQELLTIKVSELFKRC